MNSQSKQPPKPAAGFEPRHAAGLAVVGLALLDAASLQARTKPLEGVRLAESPQPAASADRYQDGRGLLALGDIPGAIAAFRAALVTAPQSIDALNGLAVAYDRIGRYDVSRSYYDAALAIDPDAALVLNNLGYSLYLQGQYQAAIPLLQKASASNDNAARNTGQRVLNLIAAKMRADAASASTTIAVAEVQAPNARIEQGANGEQRLVLAAPAPDAALTASLGDDAALVMVAKPWTAKDEAAVVAQATAEDRQAATLVAAALAAKPPAALPPATAIAQPAVAIAAIAPPAPESPAPAPKPGLDPVIATRIAAAISARIDEMVDVGVATMVAAADEIDAAADAAARRAAQGHGRRARAAIAPAHHAVEQNGFAAESAPAWLLASRRDPRAGDAAAATRDEPRDDTGTLAFDSDDGDLNAFAARMRGVEPVQDASNEAAIAKLEALLRRLRAA